MKIKTLRLFCINFIKYFSIALSVAVLAGYPFLIHANAQEETKRVLILNSYDRGLQWTDDQDKAILEKLNELDYIEISVEYMDWKLYPERTNLDLLKRNYEYKYKHKKIDLIITTDDAALDFALKNRGDIFSDAPVIFSGVLKKSAAEIIGSEKNVVGVYENIDPKGTFTLAEKINPNIKNVYIISDSTESGKASSDEIYKAVAETNKSYNIHMIENKTITEIKAMVSKLNKDSIVILGPYNMDSTGLTMDSEMFSNIISTSSAVPVYDVFEFRMGSGIMGGSLLCGKKQGEEAAQLAIKIISGVNMESLSNVDKSTTLVEFDYNQLKRYGIELSTLPSDSIIINKPYSFIEENKSLLIWFTIIFIIMLAFIIILLVYIRYREKTQIGLMESNREISALYNQLSAADVELKRQFNEIIANQEIIRESEERHRLIAEASNDVIWNWNLKTDIQFSSNRIEDILGYKVEEITNMNKWVEIIHPDDFPLVKDIIDNCLAHKDDSYKCRYRVKSKNGGYKWLLANGKIQYNKDGQPCSLVGSYTDITELKANQDEIKRLAYIDGLTELPNRVSLREYLENSIRQISDTDQKLAFFYIDLDNFKFVNDTFGHAEGDKLLIAIADRMKKELGGNSTAYRLGGDEFVILLENCKDKSTITDFGDNLLEIFSTPIKLRDMKLNVTISAGIVIYPDDGQNFDDLLKNADTAMYHVKDNGRSGYAFYDRTMNEKIKEKMIIVNYISKAIENDEFLLYYQPQYDTSLKRITGIEALIRWNSPELGFVPPSKFIEIAEDTGHISEIGEWVISSACKYAKDLQDKYNSKVIVSINISAKQLMQQDFTKKVLNIIEETGVDPNYLEFEITETALLETFEPNIQRLEELKRIGVLIALDDFGQGYSSLTYLRKLPINTLKIDKAFIDDVLISESNKRIISSIIQLAHALHLKVIAEGVEQEEQYRYLIANGCDVIQGYFISKPVPTEEIQGLLKKRKWTY